MMDRYDTRDHTASRPPNKENMVRPMQLALALSALAAASTATAQETAVTPREIQDRWVGRTLIGATAKGGPVNLMLHPDGTAELSGSATDAGSWRVSETGYCTTWKKIRAGEERCFTARRNGTTITVLNPDGSVSGSFTEIK